MDWKRKLEEEDLPLYFVTKEHEVNYAVTSVEKLGNYMVAYQYAIQYNYCSIRSFVVSKDNIPGVVSTDTDPSWVSEITEEQFKSARDYLVNNLHQIYRKFQWL